MKYLILLSSLLVGGCTLVPKKHIYTEIDIQAPLQKVWQILIDNHAYPQWNPYHVRVEGHLAIGAPLAVDIYKPNGETVHIKPHVLRLIPERELTWGGGIRGIFFGEHVFLLEANGSRQTRLIHQESFSGLAVPFASLDAIEAGYEQMNLALKKRAEQAHSAIARQDLPLSIQQRRGQQK